MVSIGEIEKVRQEIQKRIDFLRNLNDEYKQSIDRCDPAKISSKAYFIAKSENQLRSLKDHWSLKQADEIDNLETQYIAQFQRLNTHNVCECKPKKK